MSAYPRIHWQEGGVEHSARWRSESGAPPPKRVVLADDTLSADAAYRLACEGTGLLWRGDFHNARQLLQALARRVDRKPRRKEPRRARPAPPKSPHRLPAEAFHLHRQAQAQRARVLGMVLVPMAADYTVPLRRAPDLQAACTEAWGAAGVPEAASVQRRFAARADGPGGCARVAQERRGGSRARWAGPQPHPSALRRVLAGARRVRPAGGAGPAARRRRWRSTSARAPACCRRVLARRGVQRVVATDQDPRALACARDNLQRLGLQAQVEVVQADLFPPLDALAARR